VLPLVAKTTPIRARVTGTPGTTTNEGVVDREVKVAKVEAIGAKTNHVRTLRSRRIILRISY
jgi:hypothetical protein